MNKKSTGFICNGPPVLSDQWVPRPRPSHQPIMDQILVVPNGSQPFSKQIPAVLHGSQLIPMLSSCSLCFCIRVATKSNTDFINSKPVLGNTKL